MSAIVVALGGCASANQASSDRENPAAGAVAPVLEDFAETVTGTTYEIEMVAIPSGEIDGASVGPFWISRTEITWDVFDVFVYERDKQALGGATEPEVDAVSRPSKPYVPPDRGYGHEGYPTISLRYQSAQAFCAWLSARTGKTYRLPTEREWQYACLGGGGPVATDQLGDHAWFADNADWTTHPVGEKNANGFGLHDMLGNAAEWCRTNENPAAGVLMGGHFDAPADEVSHTARMQYDPSWQMMDPQVPKSPWWLSDGPFAGMRIICVPEEK